MRQLAIVAVLALAVGGCVTSSTVTEGDRQLSHQNAQAAQLILGMTAAITGLPGPGAAKAIAALEDIRLNAEQQLANWGPPKEPKEYSPENSKAAREQSVQEHASGGLGGTLLGILGAAAGIGATLAGVPWVARVFPGIVGVVGKWGPTVTTGVAKVREAFEANGWGEQSKKMLEILHDENVKHGVQKVVEKYAAKVEDKLGLDLKVGLAPTAQESQTPAT